MSRSPFYAFGLCLLFGAGCTSTTDVSSEEAGNTASLGGTKGDGNKSAPSAPTSDPDQAKNPTEPNIGSPMSPPKGASTPQCTAAYVQSQVASGAWVPLTLAQQNVDWVDPGRLLDVSMVMWEGYCCYSVRWLSNAGERNDYQVATDDGQVIGKNFEWR